MAIVAYSTLGVEIDHARKTLRRGTKTLEFARSDVQWHIVNVALAAHPGAYTLENLNKDYPGNTDVNSRKAAITEINKKLRRIGLKLEGRRVRAIT